MLKIKLVLFVVCLLFTANAFGWDDTGHKIVGFIAWQQLTPAVREKVTKILRSAPEDSSLGVYYLNGSRSDAAKQLELFMIATTWSDIIKNKSFPVRLSKYSQPNWHYSDTFWRNNNSAIEILPNQADSGGKAVEQLFAFDKLLRDSSVSDTDKATALAWVLHIGGDIHQPLHCSARVTELEPDGDKGGNLFDLAPKDAPNGNRSDLHGYWDNIITINIPRVNDACDADYIPMVANQIMTLHPAKEFENRLKIGKFDEWQKEGFAIATTKVFPSSLMRNQTPSDEYKKMAFQISQEQLALAGYRLGAMLNQIFSN